MAEPESEPEEHIVGGESEMDARDPGEDPSYRGPQDLLWLVQRAREMVDEGILYDRLGIFFGIGLGAFWGAIGAYNLLTGRPGGGFIWFSPFWMLAWSILGLIFLDARLRGFLAPTPALKLMWWRDHFARLESSGRPLDKAGLRNLALKIVASLESWIRGIFYLQFALLLGTLFLAVCILDSLTVGGIGGELALVLVIAPFVVAIAVPLYVYKHRLGYWRPRLKAYRAKLEWP